MIDTTKKVDTLAKIIRAVDGGFNVRCNGGSYYVVRDSIGQYLIKFAGGDYCIGLHGRAGTKYENELNGTDFYIES